MRSLRKAGQVALMGFDVDGVLTDGGLHFGPEGDSFKVFSSLDGHGLKLLRDSGVIVAIISGRQSESLRLRAQNLGIEELHMNVGDKLAVMASLLARHGLAFGQAGYMGDDVVDLDILRACGFSATVADGHPEVRRHVDYVARLGGGRGAAREVCDLLLRARALVGRRT
jgi:3-deoxy-D-manno-octulosonate 8-phosphate phosphatase (KDO 8-P phosphatase)